VFVLDTENQYAEYYRIDIDLQTNYGDYVVNGLGFNNSSHGQLKINQDIYSYSFSSQFKAYDGNHLADNLADVLDMFYKEFVPEHELFRCRQTSVLNIYVIGYSSLNKKQHWPEWLKLSGYSGNIYGFYDTSTEPEYTDDIVISFFNNRGRDLQLLAHEIGHFMYNQYCLYDIANGSEEFALYVEKKMTLESK